jgi:hypothetical protein
LATPPGEAGTDAHPITASETLDGVFTGLALLREGIIDGAITIIVGTITRLFSWD